MGTNNPLDSGVFVAKETECKLPFNSVSEARQALLELGAKTTAPRTFEDNRLYDDALNSLRRSGTVLRLRRYGDQIWVTTKRLVSPEEESTRHKVREEYETEVADEQMAHQIFKSLGYRPWFRYQKYREKFNLDGLEVCLDETALGCFVELEGTPEAIDRCAAKLGYTPERYILDSYLTLQQRAHPEETTLPPLLLTTDQTPSGPS